MSRLPTLLLLLSLIASPARADDAAVIAAQLPLYPLATCPISGEALGDMGAAIDVVHDGRLVRFCCKNCVKEFLADPTPVLEAQVGLQPGWTVVDIGVGTGLLSRVFLDAGCRVVGVEPSPQMAEAGRVALADAPGFRMVEGQAEATGLDDEVAELVVAAQAFHWFDPDAAAREWQRILRPVNSSMMIT